MSKVKQNCTSNLYCLWNSCDPSSFIQISGKGPETLIGFQLSETLDLTKGTDEAEGSFLMSQKTRGIQGRPFNLGELTDALRSKLLELNTLNLHLAHDKTAFDAKCQRTN